MTGFLQKISFLAELFINGTFILLYLLKNYREIPSVWTTRFFQIPIMGYLDFFLRGLVWLVPMVIFGVVLSHLIRIKKLDEFVRKYLFSILILVPLLITFGDIEFAFWLSLVHLFSSILVLFDVDSVTTSKNRIKRRFTSLESLKLRPAQTIILSFTGAIVLGTFLLKLPNSAATGTIISLPDALFTATSAICVTGLSTLSLSDNFSLFGQMVVLILIQVGGLGIMTLSTSMTVLLGKSLGMRERLVIQDLGETSSMEGLMNMVFDIIRYTFLIELWGGIVLTFAFTSEGFEFPKAIYYGFFHSISAFCNAGFSLFNTSLESYATNPLIHGTVAILITLGGLGFIVLKEIKGVIVTNSSFARISVHSKLVLITSLTLTLTAALFIFFGEYLNALEGYNVWQKFQLSLFQSITLRTAGFNTIPLSSMHTYTLYLMAMYMFIGASPGSTGGGIKTTTFSILILSIASTLKGKKDVEVFSRKISPQIVVRTIALTFISIIITSLFILILMKLEPEQPFLSIVFEVISAGATVGLSLGGVTPYLSVLGKVAISVLMLIGRTGPLTLVLAIGEKHKSAGKIEYPDGRLMIG